MANEENLKPWKPGQSGNPNGRPPKMLTEINREMKDAGYERVSPSHVAEAYEMLLGMDEDNIRAMTNDTAQPYIIRVVGKMLLDKSKGFEAIERMLDRVHGKPKQVSEAKIEGTVHVDWSK